MFENYNIASRLFRASQLALAFISLKLKIKPRFISKTLQDILEDYRTADIIFVNGGGYFRSQNGITQSLNLLMLYWLFEFIKIYKNKVIIAPTEFGPFAHTWQEKMIARVLADFNQVFIRSINSFEQYNKYNQNSVISHDLALNLAPLLGIAKRKDFTIGFTIRKWMPKKQQDEFEEYYAEALADFHRETNCAILPIIQVTGIDDDRESTQNIIEILKRKGINTLSPEQPADLNQALEIYAEINMIFGMRMHSNILAATQGIPFAAISYEYKTEGISKSLGMRDYCIKCDEATPENLFQLLMRTYINRDELKIRIKNSIKHSTEEISKKINF